MMTDDFDPHIDTVAAQRWAVQRGQTPAPWLHQEVTRRMAERLDFIKLPTKTWCDASNPFGGKLKHTALARSWWWRFQKPPSKNLDMVWSNMQLHMEANPKTIFADWHAALKVNGFVLFSCLGPDTLIELRTAYARRGWPSPSHTFTDMHDWGDRLVAQGFAEPVMDMERLQLTFTSPERALQELRELGRNLNPERSPSLRGRTWRQNLLVALEECRNAEGQIVLTFELIYGHAMKSSPKIKLSTNTTISLETMRNMLHK